MKLEHKRSLAARSLQVGEGRVVFNSQRLGEIKEAITKQDIKDLHGSGAILVREKQGRRTLVKRKTRRRAGSVRKKVNSRKRDYITITRKLRAYIARLSSQGKITREEVQELRKEIRNRVFRSLAHMKERVAGGKK